MAIRGLMKDAIREVIRRNQRGHPASVAIRGHPWPSSEAINDSHPGHFTARGQSEAINDSHPGHFTARGQSEAINDSHPGHFTARGDPMHEPGREEKQLACYRGMVQPIACKGRTGASRVLWGKGHGRRGEHSRADTQLSRKGHSPPRTRSRQIVPARGRRRRLRRPSSHARAPCACCRKGRSQAHQCSSDLISAHQCSSTLINAHPWPSVALMDNQRERERELRGAHLQPWCTDAQVKRGSVSAPPKSAAAASSPTDPDTYASMFFTHAARS